MKKFFICVVAAITLCASLAGAEEPSKVAVFPFYVFSRQPLTQLRQGLQNMLADRLVKQGIPVVSTVKTNQSLDESGKPLDLSLARTLAGKLGADYGIYGSVTIIGNRVSLDVKVLDALGMSRPQSVFVEGEGLDSLPDLTGKLAGELVVKVSGREKVASIKVEGNKKIESAAILAAIKTKKDGAYSPILLDKDLRAIWKMGYFDDVRVKTTDAPDGGKNVTIQVKEKPIVREVQISGNKAVDTKDLRDQTGIKPHTVFRPGSLKEAEAKITKMYHDKGYYDAKVTAKVVDLPSKDKGIRINIEEGKKVFIKEIRFSGNKHFEDKKLREQMSTKQEGWFSWITDDNILERSKLEQDREKLTDFYLNNGYLQVRVGEPDIKRGEGGLIVTFPIIEGDRFKVSAVTLSGEMIAPQKDILAKFQTKPGDWFNRTKVRQDLTYLHDLYADRGYAYVEVRPHTQRDKDKKEVSINFDVKKGIKVWFERIIITGNNRTRDKVIRRELGVAEGDLFSSQALRRSNMRLRRLGYFEDVHVTTSRGTAPDRMDLKVNVKEKRTGNFSLGFGYSTVDQLMLMGSISESNLFGRGQRLELKASLGGKSNRYSIAFTEPWFMDKPISFGVDIYDWKREYTSYDKEAIGGRIRFGFPTGWRYTRLYTYYKYEGAEVTGVNSDAATIIKDQEGYHTTSSLKFTLRRDSRNKAWNPDHGSDNSISMEYAGGPLGGSNAFIKTIADSGWYIPLFWDTTFVVHGKAGYVTKHSGGDLPIYEKFFLGGINTLRGYDYLSVGPKDAATGDVIGGEYMGLANIELRFPLLKEAGFIGLVFYDTGNAWTDDQGFDLSDLRSSVGAGIRWYSPMGPLRLEYGYALDPQPGDSTSNWEFTVGSMF